MKRHLYILIIFTVLGISLNAQQLPQFSFRHQNLILNNPAAAGSSVFKELKILHRQQWVGFENAPASSFISYHQEMNESSGLGGYIISDRTFPTSRFIINASYAYIIDMDDMFLSFGLAGMVMQYRFKNTDLTYRDPLDPSLAFSSDKKWRPEANAGIMIYNNRFYASFTVSQILKSSFRPFSSGEEGLIQMSRHICMSGQYDFLTGINRFSPALYFSYAKSSPLVSELSFQYLYDNRLSASVGYRLEDALSFSVGYRYDRFYLAYSFDLVTSSFKVNSSNSHEIMFAVDISTKANTAPMFSSGGSTSQRRNMKSTKRFF